MTRTPGDKHCGAEKRQGEGVCAKPAGWATSHPGFGYCKFHIGATPAGTIAAHREQALLNGGEGHDR